MVSARRLYCVKTSSQFKLFLANLNRISVLKSYSLFFFNGELLLTCYIRPECDCSFNLALLFILCCLSCLALLMYMFLPLHVLRVDDVRNCRCQRDHFIYVTVTHARGRSRNLQNLFKLFLSCKGLFV
jgi:hypothetical protein